MNARLTALLPLLLAGCSMAPEDVRPPSPVPASWPVGDAYLRQTEASLPVVSYRDVFVDPRLQTLIDQALVNNRDLRVAAANIVAARAQYRIQRSELFPQIDASASYTRSRSGGRSFTGGNGAVPGDGTDGGNAGGNQGGSGATTIDRFGADLGVTSFEIDLFGRIRSLTRAQQNQYFATEAAARATRLTLVADIADAWLTYAADTSLLRIAEQTAASAERSVTLTRARLRGGVAPRTDLRQAEQILTAAQADVAEQRTQLAQDVNALQLLVGAPFDRALLPQSIEQAAPAVRALPAGVDSGVLLRRPDVVQAEYQLRAANAEIGAARAALFPRISLTAVLGLASNALGSLFDNGAFTYSAGPSVAYPIFQAGAARANVRLTEAQREGLLAEYERTIQIAFREVSDALARQGTIGEQLRATEAQTAAAEDTFTLTEARYRGGIDTFLASLDAQRSLYQSQRTLVQTRLVAASNRVTLYRTLGGDTLLEATDQGPIPATPAD
ncbi:efflux transporter outer membrane subunit [Sphingomonas desiccabilis]|uniref:Efflux transporter outer membrane subunit n=1 Tax=Sphingomonas desiccabilis TaxID=429134 RepID=A0A4Q2IMR3_9SPHN|nr:efflux transporter outer membrane subunit [Sphingomonas desiccabilis]MBB3912493.1 multidrug efflux system outer membrane protein [Sphingomonas desiccabilis]RXZ30603.1 efflux transporter outer membrane subunit [Sphingomonas desiccabilis]